MAHIAARLTVLLAIAAALVAARVATAAIPTPVNGQITDAIAGIDTNHDGAVDSAEWQAAGDRTFNALDSDKDGTISREEFTMIHGVTFPVMDINRDGKVSADEADAYKRLPWTLGLFR